MYFCMPISIDFKEGHGSKGQKYNVRKLFVLSPKF